MTAYIIDGKKLAEEFNAQTKVRVANYVSSYSSSPRLDLVLVGNREDSKKYISSKARLAKSIGIDVVEHIFKDNISSETFITEIEKITLKSNAVLVQLPLPDQIDESLVLSSIDPGKDPDGLHPETISRLVKQDFTFENDVLPCTPMGVINLINSTRWKLGKPTDLAGINATVCGRSNLVGGPTALLLKKLGAIVTVCHSQTLVKDRFEALKNADIIVSAVGKAGLISASDVKPGAIVIDVGINYDSSGNLVGDVDFKAVSSVASAITPVPGGVGPMTLAMLMRNVIILAENQKNKL